MLKMMSTAAVGVFAALSASASWAAPALEDYGKLPAVEVAELSPDGSRLAYVGALKGERSIVVLAVGGEVLAATPVKDQIADALQWAGDGIVILRTHRSIKGLENKASNLEPDTWLFEPWTIQEVTAIDLAHRSSQSLVATPKLRFFPAEGPLEVRQIQGRWYAFLPGIPARPNDVKDNPPSNLYRVDLETGEANKVDVPAVRTGNWVVGADGSVVAWSAVEATRGAWSVRAPGSDKALAEGGRVGEYRAAWVYGLGRTADTVILDEKEGRAESFSVVKLDGSGTTPLQDQPLVQRLWFDPKSGQLIGYTAGADEMKVTLFDAKVQARVDAAYKAFPDYSVQLISASANFGRMIVQTRGKDDAGTFWLVDLSTGKATPLGSSAPIPGADFATVTTFDYKAADGLAMHGVLTLPAGGGKNLPVVVMPTGTGSLRARPEFDWWAQAFASRGYAVFQPNPRGVVGFGNAFHVAGQGELTRKSLSDVIDGVQALGAAGVIDPSRLCTVGEDMGGFSALSVVAVQKFPARCVVGFATPSDLSKILIEVYWQDMVAKQRRSGPYTGAAPVHFDDASPNKYIQNIRSPVMLIHPRDDANVPVTVSRTFAEAMKKAGKAAEVVELDGADHFLWDSQTRIATLKASVAFVEKNNPAK